MCYSVQLITHFASGRALGKKLLSAWSGGCSGEGPRGREKPLLSGASVRDSTLSGAAVPAALMEAASALGEGDGILRGPGAPSHGVSHSWVLQQLWEEMVSRLGGESENLA